MNVLGMKIRAFSIIAPFDMTIETRGKRHRYPRRRLATGNRHQRDYREQPREPGNAD
jgi:hypothetical protein